jgi:hypothetical protein
VYSALQWNNAYSGTNACTSASSYTSTNTSSIGLHNPS